MNIEAHIEAKGLRGIKGVPSSTIFIKCNKNQKGVPFPSPQNVHNPMDPQNNKAKINLEFNHEILVNIFFLSECHHFIISPINSKTT